MQKVTGADGAKCLGAASCAQAMAFSEMPAECRAVCDVKKTSQYTDADTDCINMQKNGHPRACRRGFECCKGKRQRKNADF